MHFKFFSKFFNSKFIFLFILELNLVYSSLSLTQLCENTKLDGNNIYQYIQIYTIKEFYLNDEFIEEKNIILNNCELDQNWNVNESNTFYNSVDKIYENENINRRTFRIKMIKNSLNKSIVIKEIKISITKSKLSHYKLPFILNNGNSFDFFIDYNCNKDKWIDIKITIEFDDNLKLDFDYVKICQNNQNFLTNSTYFILVIIFILLSHLCEKDYLIFNIHIIKINPEEIIDLKYAEHITIYTLIIMSIFILLGILTLFKQLAYASGFLISLISIKFLLKSSISLLNPNFDQTVSNHNYFIPKIDLTISLSKIIYYSAGTIIFFIWIIYFNNFILTDIIAFSITYLVVKKFHFRNFYFILFLFLFVIIYNFIWIFIQDENFKYEDNFNFSSGDFINIPIRFSIPEIIKSQFDTHYFFSILDLILIGFLIEYLKYSSKNLDKNYLSYGRYGLILGLVINLFIFYVLKRSYPFFIFPGLIMIVVVIGFSYYKAEFNLFSHFDRQEKYQNKKIVKEYPLHIIGADQSEDYNEMMNSKKYVPPNIISEIDCIKEESPREINNKNILNMNENNEII